MISPVANTQQKPNTIRRRIISDSGYTAVATGTICGLTGFKQVKFPHKTKVHKYCAYLTAISTFTHWGAVKRWDKKLLNKFQ